MHFWGNNGSLKSCLIKNIFKWLIGLAVGFGLVFLWFVWAYFQLAFSPLVQFEDTIKVEPNTGIHTITGKLEDKGYLTHPQIFIFIAKICGDSHRLRFGEYEIKPGMSAFALLDNMVKGRGLAEHHVTIIEGWNFRQVMQRLKNDESLRHVVEDKSPRQIMKLLGSEQASPEGLLFPDTYSFTWGNTDLDVIKHAYEKMQSVLKDEWQQRSKRFPYKTPYKALIIASLIEKETSVDSERHKIASVILLRLKKWMPLQVDPTVLYGRGKPFGASITRSDLKNKNPYNTYMNYGLPPTPIAMPSKASIHAALHPAQGKALYYVAQGDGSHIFSDSYKKHRIAVKAYRRYEARAHQHHIYRIAPIPSYLRRSPYVKFASYIVCFICL